MTSPEVEPVLDLVVIIPPVEPASEPSRIFRMYDFTTLSMTLFASEPAPDSASENVPETAIATDAAHAVVDAPTASIACTSSRPLSRIVTES